MNGENANQQAEATEQVTEQVQDAQEVSTETSGSETNVVDTGGENEVREGMFEGEDVPTEAELRGEDVGEPEESSGEEAADPQPKDDGKGSETGDDAQEIQTEDEEAGERPPQGFVPQQALHEARAKTREYRDHLDAALREIEALRVGSSQKEDAKRGEGVEIPEDLMPEVNEFRQKYQEHADLLLENSPQGQRLRDRLAEYGTDEAAVLAETFAVRRALDKAEAAKKAEAEQMDKDALDHFAQQRFTQMAEHVPGLWDKGNPVQSEIEGVAYEHGFVPEALSVLTDPRTKVVVGGNQFVLGDAAVSLVRVLAAARSGAKATPNADLEKMLQDARAEGASEALQKFKKNAGPKGLGDVAPGAGGASPSASESLTEDEYARLSPEERERYLRGG